MTIPAPDDDDDDGGYDDGGAHTDDDTNVKSTPPIDISSDDPDRDPDGLTLKMKEPVEKFCPVTSLKIYVKENPNSNITEILENVDVSRSHLDRISKKYNLKIIEDSADTLGAKIGKKYTGFFSDISITSFYGSHVISCAGNGGMVCFNDKSKYTKAKLLRSWGRSSSLFDEKSEKIENRFNIKLDGILYDKKFVFEKIGHNLEPSELGAAFGLVYSGSNVGWTYTEK